MTLSELEAPPPFEPANVIELTSTEGSKITNVSLYTGRAEITRLYKLSVATGQNQVIINGLPDALDRESLRCPNLLVSGSRWTLTEICQ